MRFARLGEWLAWQEGLHPRAVDLGLERVREVWMRMRAPSLPGPVVTVAGTNGKGSSVAMLEAILRAGGYSTGCYTSPHLQRYNERIRIDGAEVDDRSLCEVFERVDRSRAGLSLTYFEFGTLAALDLFAAAAVDAVVLEVGLGGRLDATNIVDADVALITPLGLDHTEWLGPDLESIGREKAGILRAGRPVVVASRNPPDSLFARAAELDSPCYRLGREFDARSRNDAWDWMGPGTQRYALPLPSLRGDFQLDNAAAVFMVLELLSERLPIDQRAMREGLLAVRLPGRFEIFSGNVPVIVDVAHNLDSARALLANLQRLDPKGDVHSVFAALRDKDLRGIIATLAPVVASWHLAQLATERATPATELERIAREVAGGTDRIAAYPGLEEALRGAIRASRPGDWVLAWGSFHVAGGVRDLLERD